MTHWPVAILATAIGCGSAQQTPTLPPKCSTCHVRPQPGSMPHDVAETAMGRHHARVRMTDGEWARVVEVLSQVRR